MKPKLPIGTRCLILDSPAAYAAYREGVISGYLENGYAVDIDLLDGKSPVTVWAASISPLAPPEPAAPLLIEPS